MQETPPKFQHPCFPTMYCSNAPKKKRGVAISIKDTVSFKHIHAETDGYIYAILVCEVNNAIYTIVNVYIYQM